MPGQANVTFGQMQPTVQGTKVTNIKHANFLTNAQTQYNMGIAQWYGALTSGTQWKQDFLRRVFHVLYHAGIVFKDNAGWHDWNTDCAGIPVAAAMSHGGRILIQLPPSAAAGAQGPNVANMQPGVGAMEHWKFQNKHRSQNDPGDYAFWNWLNAGGFVTDRYIATHATGMSATYEVLPSGGKKYVEETKGTDKEGMKKGRHHALNPNLGGGGSNLSPIDAQPVAEDGTNGHVYIYFRPPTARFCGSMLIGCENCQYGKSNSHTGGGHSILGTSQEVSATGCPKWSNVPGAGPKPTGGVGKTIVDLTNGWNWLTPLALFNPNDLDRPPQTAVGRGANLGLLMSVEKFLLDSGRSKSKGSPDLTNIDVALQQYWTGQNQDQSLYAICRNTAQYVADKTRNGQVPTHQARTNAAQQLHYDAMHLLQVADPIGYSVIQHTNF